MISAIKPIETTTIFIFSVPGQNLSEDNIVFTVKRLVHNFLCEKEFLVEKKEKKVGRSIEYKMDELLSLVVYGVLYNKTRLDDLVN
ncbi:MAG: hypothetical protein LBM96_12590 [Methanobrevibacter sp.]|jgi:hypothetical protein|nr:hypothetical protein [Candidatus Methanoflexus mossambicus]